MAALGADPAEREARFYESFFFAGPELADELGALVLAGHKRATAALVWSLEAEGQAPPRPGALSIVTNARGEALCVIETCHTEIVPFDQVTAAFAAPIEGEGDKSLRFCARRTGTSSAASARVSGREPSLSMPVLCEQFKVVWRADGGPVD